MATVAPSDIEGAADNLDPEKVAAMAKILSHPGRVKVLEVIAEGAASSPVQATALLSRRRKDLGNVNYHVTALAKAGCLELVATRQVRGAVEHFYEPTKLGQRLLLWAASF